MQNTVFQISLKKLLWLKKLKPLYPGNLLLSSDIKDEEIVGIFYIKELQRTNQKEFRGEKVIKRKSDKLYVKWNGYDNLFNSWIDKKRQYKLVNIFQNQNFLGEV